VKEMNEEMITEYKKTGNIEIRNKIMEKNIGLVKKICSKLGYSDELFQEGMLLLKKSIDKFDIERGFKFSTFAYNFIKCGLQDYIAENIKYNGNLTKRESHELSKLYKKQQELKSPDCSKYEKEEFKNTKGARLKHLKNKSTYRSLDITFKFEGEDIKLLDIIEAKENNKEYEMFKLDIKNILTDKEIVFIELLEWGYSFDEIAEHLDVTKRTVYNIFKPIREKIVKYFNN
jgi:RNA polymerase sigma factor (sigma-70 family)